MCGIGVSIDIDWSHFNGANPARRHLACDSHDGESQPSNLGGLCCRHQRVPDFSEPRGRSAYVIETLHRQDAVDHRLWDRPLDLCLIDGIAMYIARLANSFILKRMPNTGSHHAPDCPSYEPPAEFSGLEQVLGSAIIEDPITGETTLKLDFSMSKNAGRSAPFSASRPHDSVVADGTKLSLRSLLHYLWDQAELTRWKPGFVGKRSWATVRRYLLQAAENKIARGDALHARLYIPEVFSVEQREPINARRLLQWAHAVTTPSVPQPLMLLIAEVKEIVPAHDGFKAVIKHVPDQAFVLDEQLYSRMRRRFASELSLWGLADNLHMVMIATFSVSNAGIPTIAELSLMPVTFQWLPIEDALEQKLIERLVREGRSFVKELRYNLPPQQALASAVLIDAGESPIPLYIAPWSTGREFADSLIQRGKRDDAAPVWFWHTAQQAMPPLPMQIRKGVGVKVAPARTSV